MFRALLRGLNKVLRGEEELSKELCAATIVAIPHTNHRPKGPEDYRPISLMQTTTKILCYILNNRLTSWANTRPEPFISATQAGFRQGCEAIAQVVALYELSRRRSLDQKDTYLVFVDIKKAYDTVPHRAIFQRLERIGVGPRTRRVIRQLYLNAIAKVRHGTEWFRVERGIRPGDPMSPMLFNLCIDPLLQRLQQANETRIPGYWEVLEVGALAYADDIVLLFSVSRQIRHKMHWI